MGELERLQRDKEDHTARTEKVGEERQRLAGEIKKLEEKATDTALKALEREAVSSRLLIRVVEKLDKFTKKLEDTKEKSGVEPSDLESLVEEVRQIFEEVRKIQNGETEKPAEKEAPKEEAESKEVKS